MAVAPPSSSATDRTDQVGFWLFAGHLLAVSGIALSNVFLGLMILWSCRRRTIRKMRQSWPRLAPLWLPAGVYLVLFLVSVSTSLEPRISVGELKDILVFTTFFLAPLLVRGEQRLRQLVDLLCLMFAGLAVHGIWQYYFTDLGGIDDRIPGLFSHYQTFAGVLLVGLMVLAARLATRDGWRRPLDWLAFGFVAWALLLTLTRGAWIASALTLPALAVQRTGRRVAVASLALIALLVVLAPAEWRERVTSITDLRDFSNYDRLCMAEAAMFMISERPLFGIGPEVVKERYPIYRHPTAPRFDVPHLHNSFLQRAAEQGLLSLIAYGWLMIAAWRLAYGMYRREGGADGARADLLLATLLVIVSFNVAGLFEDNWRDTEIRRIALFVLCLPLCLRVADHGTLHGTLHGTQKNGSSS